MSGHFEPSKNEGDSEELDKSPCLDVHLLIGCGVPKQCPIPSKKILDHYNSVVVAEFELDGMNAVLVKEALKVVVAAFFHEKVDNFTHVLQPEYGFDSYKNSVILSSFSSVRDRCSPFA